MTNFSTTLTIIGNITTICADHLINESLEGISGRIAWGIIQIILMIWGNLGNLLTLLVLNHRLMRKGGANNLLQGLAISDIIAPTVACIPHLIYYYSPRNDLIHFINVYLLPLATGATFCSNWIIVTITSFRLFIVVKPLYSQVYCSSRKERKALLTICLVGLFSISPYYYFQTHFKALNILKVISAVLSLLIPWLICVILWIVLIRIVSRDISSKQSQQIIFNSDTIAQRLKSKSRITRMVLIICFFNIICQLPVLILTIYGLINGDPCGFPSAMIFAALFFLSNLLLIVNHSINFSIYSLTNSKFRYTLKLMFCHCLLYDDERWRGRTMTLYNDELRRSFNQHRSDGNPARETPRSLFNQSFRENYKQVQRNSFLSVQV